MEQPPSGQRRTVGECHRALTSLPVTPSIAGMSSQPQEARWRELIRDVPDFPQPGILFRDTTPLLHDITALRSVNDALAEAVDAMGATVIAAIEARGFMFGVPVAERLGLPFVPVRKPGKLATAFASVEYELEYGQDSLELQREPSVDGQRVAIVDDLIATGGTARAAGQLVETLGGETAGFAFLVELTALDGRDRLPTVPVTSLLQY
jgi:adenine phosphoribosyltransferase